MLKPPAEKPGFSGSLGTRNTRLHKKITFCAAHFCNWHDFCFSLFEPVFPAHTRLKPPFDGDIRCS
ncbi:hypothetical protein BRY73_04265 [Ochrobactrum sp. P6BS-III]|nr:hypothetical protein BRY73_04265 [Ochrobactrum sp. P6BS-III]